ncbi:MAG TPA: response regulator transcription factor [Flavisolibacter sp.]|nr:response regulator transcription factor [Flavisolibacter sp.]
MKGKIALVDDHVLLRNGLANLLEDLDYEVVFQANNGKHFIELLQTHEPPQVVLMDINMPLMNGYETTLWLKENHPSIQVLVLSMLDDEDSVIRMIRNGAKGYVIKDCEPDELKAAISAVLHKGFYHSEMVSSKLLHAINSQSDNDASSQVRLTEKEREFLKWICTELSYKEIADKMNISPRTVDTYRDNLQEKLGCKGRVSLVLWSIKNGVFSV